MDLYNFFSLPTRSFLFQRLPNGIWVLAYLCLMERRYRSEMSFGSLDSSASCTNFLNFFRDNKIDDPFNQIVHYAIPTRIAKRWLVAGKHFDVECWVSISTQVYYWSRGGMGCLEPPHQCTWTAMGREHRHSTTERDFCMARARRWYDSTIVKLHLSHQFSGVINQREKRKAPLYPWVKPV